MDKQSESTKIKSSRDSPASALSEKENVPKKKAASGQRLSEKKSREQQEIRKEIEKKTAQYSARQNEMSAYSGSTYVSSRDFSEDDEQEHTYLKTKRQSRQSESGTNTAEKKLSARKSSFSEKDKRSSENDGSKSGKTKTMSSRSRLKYDDSEKSMSKNAPVHGRNRIKKAAKAAAVGASQLYNHSKEEEISQEDVQDALKGELGQSATAAKRGSRELLRYTLKKAKNRQEEADDEPEKSDTDKKSATDSENNSDGRRDQKSKTGEANGKRAEAEKDDRTAREKAKSGDVEKRKQESDQKSAYLQERKSKFSDGSPEADLKAEIGQDGSASNAASKKAQKKKIKQQYAQAVANRERDAIASGAANTGSVAATNAAAAAESSAAAESTAAAGATAVSVSIPLLVIGLFFLILFIIILLVFLSFGSASGVTTATTYQASTNDILDMNNQYEKLEEELQQEIKRTPDDYPDYDEYEYELDEISHNGNVLASYFTALNGDFKSDEISDELKDLFSRQYEIVREERTETRTRTEPETTFDDQGNATTTYVEVEYQAKILKTKLINHNLSEICQEKLGSELSPRYLVYLEATGNRPELFGGEVSPDDLYAYYYKDGKIDMNVDDLPDTLVGKMLSIAHDQEKKPYVYGAAHGADYYSDNPSAFDCSSFVSWVLKNSIAKDDFACRDTNGLKSVCDDIPTSEAQPGDLIFFKNTYNYPGISHVGIYIGDGQMIHAGNPVKVSRIDTQYWQSHFVGFGRLKAEYQR